MRITNFPEYAQRIEAILDAVVEAQDAVSVAITIDSRSLSQGYIAVVVSFHDASELHIREFVDLNQINYKLMYAYHYQNAAKELVFRYDNASHQPALAQPEHKHTPAHIELLPAPDLSDVIGEIIGLITG